MKSNRNDSCHGFSVNVMDLSAIAAIARRKLNSCTWLHVEGYEYEQWRTDCGQDFLLTDGTPSSNLMKFCCYCGNVLTEVEGEDNNHESEAEYRSNPSQQQDGDE